ncbi:MAG: SLOG family protein [Oscillospiraceae bacterium]|nr:SLOG family protein [Oscillospiraceae bacterium]
MVKRLKSEIITLIQRGVIYFGAGGALEFDTVAAQTVVELKKVYPQIKLILVLPCKTQTRGWRKEDIAQKLWGNCLYGGLCSQERTDAYEHCRLYGVKK